MTSQQSETTETKSNHLSYSEIRNWLKCPFYHKITYVDRIPSESNLFFAFGKAIHKVCEDSLFTNSITYGINSGSVTNTHINKAMIKFNAEFAKLVKKLSKELDKEKEERNKQLLSEMKNQARPIISSVVPTLIRYFKKFEIISFEEKLYEDIQNKEDWKFKGFIDLVIKTPYDGKYHLIDWKTCSWGWDMRKKNDKMNVYQLTFYKHFFAEKHNIDPRNVETYFGLLKRTAKNNNTEMVRVTSGKKRTQNALNLLEKALYNIERQNYIKNKLACTRCELYMTKYCQRNR